VVLGSSAGTVERLELSLARAKCSRCRHRFTCYPPGFYPHRQYQLDVVAEAVAEVALGGHALAEVACAIRAGATSIRRWLVWLIGLAKPRELVVVAARLDPDAPPGAGVAAMVGVAPSRRQAAQVLAALEHLGLALLRRGVTLAERTGLGRVLGWQRQLHGDVYGLVAGVRTLDCPAMVHVESLGGL